MKNGKRVLSIFFIVLMILTVTPLTGFVGLEIALKAKAYSTGDHIQFGTYPQTLVAPTTDLLAAAGLPLSWKSYDYYAGVLDENYGIYYGDELYGYGKMKPSSFMMYKDFMSNGVKYRAVKFSAYRPANTLFVAKNQSGLVTRQDENGFDSNTIYFFKYEPLTWRVLDPSTGYIMCESLIDSQAYQDVMYYVNGRLSFDADGLMGTGQYDASTIRYWLNFDFYETAFSESQKRNIKSTDFDGTIRADKVFLLSWNDANNSSYGFNPNGNYGGKDPNREATATDYAKCQGVGVPYSVNDEHIVSLSWWLRSGDCVEYDGYMDRSDESEVTDTDYGIRPVCCISNLISDTSLSDTLFSKDREALLDGTTNVSGPVGNNLKWKLDQYGTLTISGNGSMINYDSAWTGSLDVEAPPWYDNWDSSIQSIVVEDGVTSIGDYSLLGLPYATSISLPNTLTSIGVFAFNATNNLNFITIPASVQSIGGGAFSKVESVDCDGWDIYRNIAILNPDCEITESFIFDNYDCGAQTLGNEKTNVLGYTGSTAEAYASKFNLFFSPLDLASQRRTDPLTGISLQFSDSAFGAGVAFSVKPQSVQNPTPILSKEFEKATAWDIKPILNGIAVQPTEPVTITIPVPEGFDESSLAAYHVIDEMENEIEKVENITVSDGLASFETSSFSVFYLVDENSEHHHDYSYSIYVFEKPTCTSFGRQLGICSCGKDRIEKVDPLGHDLIQHEAKEATCTEDGWSAYVSCSRCSYTTFQRIDAIGHDIIWHDSKEPTCTEVGWKRYATCSRCDFTTYVELETRHHVLISHRAKAATCTEIGWDDYETCVLCDYTTYTEKDALGHSPSSAVIENEIKADCGKNGSYDEVVYCETCKQELSRNMVTTDALDHTDDNNDGHCDRCGEQMTGGDHCKYCGQIHGGAFGWLVKFFHSILAFFKR